MSKDLKQFVAIDVETTGLLQKDRIIEVGVFKFDGKGHEISSFKSFVNPKRKLPQIISSITGIYPKDLVKAPGFSKIKDKVVEMVGDLPVIGHNLGFDLGFFEKEGVSFKDNLKFDTWKLATILLPKMASHSLEILIKQLNIEAIESHRALEDAKASANLFLLLKKEIKKIDESKRKRIVEAIRGAGWELEELFLEKSTVKTLKNKEALTKPKREKKAEWSVEAINKMMKDAQLMKKAVPLFELREEQVDLSKAVSNVLENKGKALIEGGANLGKRLAYLIPAIHYARARNIPVIIATSNFKLQKWILEEEVPLLRRIIPFDFKVATLKERKKYLCGELYKKFKTRKNKSQDALSLIVKIELWIQESQDGDLDNLATTFEEKKYLNGLGCQDLGCSNKDCFYQKAQEKALKSDLLFLTHKDLLNFSNILIGKALIADEAHLLEKGVEESLKKRVALDNFEKAKVFLSEESKNDFDEVLDKIALFFGVLGILAKKKQKERRENYRVVINEDIQGDWDWEKLENSLEGVALSIDTFSEKLDLKEKDNKKAKEILSEEKKKLEEILRDQDNDFVSWIEIKQRPIREISVVRASLDIKEVFTRKILDKLESVILISSILTTKKKFDFIKERLGLDDKWLEKEIEVENFNKDISLLVAEDMPRVESGDYFKKLKETIIDLAKKNQGKNLVLFTSMFSIKEVYRGIYEELEKEGISVLAQGVTGGKAKTLNIFKESERCVFLASSAFWEERALKDNDLKALIITKLPFEVPTDPVVSAKTKKYRNGFMSYSVPQAILKFRQGVEKITKLKKGKGIVLILDNRVVSQRYGIDFIESLPKMKIVYGDLDKLKPFWG